MRVSVLINKLVTLYEQHGDLPVVILDSECEQELREFSASSVGLSDDRSEIQIEAYE